ncbi:hypothetical protein SLEP1_g48259 [Rubroshorea leprosula]|uniref:Uncharacterized protein n=1 Tax=Rubroshorea leprosula TaxID=152421 RepID=A0AAV5LU06_9ROSI|nr:hypothetical protein SLEP1_g48259 [Rubroshorea leprosula]
MVTCSCYGTEANKSGDGFPAVDFRRWNEIDEEVAAEGAKRKETRWGR